MRGSFDLPVSSLRRLRYQQAISEVVMGWFSSDKGVADAQKNTDKIIAKNGGTKGKDGKWDMKKGVEAEKAKGQKK
jgi:hypothetical protein